jgi:chromosome segregation ATPase
MSAPVITPETASRIALAPALASAVHDATMLKLRLQAATELRRGPRESRAHIAAIRAELQAAEERLTAADQAVTEADRAAREERDRVRDESRKRIVDEARDVVRSLLPFVEQVDRLNGQLEALRARLGNTGEVPVTAFRPHLLTTTRWLQAAKCFVGDGGR